MNSHLELMTLVRQLTAHVSKRATMRARGFPLETERALDEMVDRAFFRLGRRLGEVLDEIEGGTVELNPQTTRSNCSTHPGVER